MDAVRLRPASQIDAAAIGAVHVAAWHETYAGIVPDAIPATSSVEMRTAMWLDILANPHAFGDATVIVAEERGHIVGFGSCGRQRDDALVDAGFGAEIGTLYVLRSHQGRQIGRSLMRAMAHALTDRGHRAASLWVLSENIGACRFYDALGGEVVDERNDVQPGATLVEIAYGWRDVSCLVR